MRRAVVRWRCGPCLGKSRQQSTSAATTAPSAGTARLLYSPISRPLQRYNALISRIAERGDVAKALQKASELKEVLARSNEKPDVTTYESIAKAFAVHGFYREAFRLLDDAKDVGVVADVGLFNQILRVGVHQKHVPVLSTRELRRNPF